MDQNLKKAIESTGALQKIRDIGLRHNLHIDQAGILEQEITAVMRGNLHADEFVDSIEEKLGIETDEAIAITTEVNLDIFQAIRQAMQNQQSADSATEQPETPDRESILSEIENPTPTVHPISAADQTIPGPAAPKEVVSDLVANKLMGTVMIPSQKINVPAEIPAKSTVPQPPTPPKPQSYAADPYREPLM